MAKRLEDGGRIKVIATARRLFQQHGFHQTAMAELSELADVSIGQIYRLFANKSDMIAAIIQEDTDARIARLTEIRDAVATRQWTAQEGFRQATLDALSQGDEALQFEIFAEGFRNPQIGDEIGRLCDRYRAMLREIILIAQPNVQEARLAAAEEMLVALLFGLGNRSLLRPQLTCEETARHAADMILAMLAG